MDFDDTWHPATHPSGAVLPAVLALSDMMPAHSKPSGQDFLLAFNVGVEIQGRLMRFSNEANAIPKRWAPQSMGQIRHTTLFYPQRCTLMSHKVIISYSLFLEEDVCLFMKGVVLYPFKGQHRFCKISQRTLFLMCLCKSNDQPHYLCVYQI